MSLQASIDWYSFVHKATNDPDYVIKEFLGLDAGLFEDRGYGVRGYRECKQYDNISVCYNGREGTKHENGHGSEFMGVYVCLSGNALKQYAKLGGDLVLLMAKTCASEDVNITRLDIAADDEEGRLDIGKMSYYCETDRIRSHTRNRDTYQTRKGKVPPAQTIYVGSRKSEQFVRIYDKAKEQYDPSKNPEEYNSHWLRVELVTRRERARNAVYEIMEAMSVGKTVGECLAEFLNGFMQFIELDDSNISRCSVAAWWHDFLETLKEVKLFVTRESSHVMERKIIWFFDSLAPLMSAIIEGIGEKALLRIIRAGGTRRKREYEKMLDVYEREPFKTPLSALLGGRYRYGIKENEEHFLSDSREPLYEVDTEPDYRLLRGAWSFETNKNVPLTWEQLTGVQ